MMRTYLLICLHPNHKQVNWATFDSKGQLVESATQVPNDTVPHQNYTIFVLIPGTEVLLTQADIPSKQWQRIVQAVPYALEEQLAEEVEKLHFALGKREVSSGNIAVAVVARTQMDGYLQQLQMLGFATVPLIPDILAVPKPSDGWGILLIEGIALVRTGLCAGFAIETACLFDALSATLLEQEVDPPQQITIFSGIETTALTVELAALGIPITEKNHQEGTLAWMAQELVANKPLNLLQGDYRPQDKILGLLRPWRLTALLLVFWGGLVMADQWFEYHQLRQQRQTLNAQIEKVYRETFPQARKIVNPRVQMEQKLAMLRTQQGSTTTIFLPILTKISTQLAHTPGFKLKQLDYRQGGFDLQLTVASLQALEHLKQRLTDLEMNVEMRSATSHVGQVESRLHITFD